MERVNALLDKEGTPYECELDCDDPDPAYRYIGMADGIPYTGIIIYSPKLKRPAFLGFDMGKMQRDEAEGIPESESRSIIDFPNARLFVLWLNGTAMRVYGEHVRAKTKTL